MGYTALAWEYLERAQADPGDAERLIAMAECALLARHGDAALAEERLLAVHERGIVPREFWRVTLMRAYAALRRGDDVAARWQPGRSRRRLGWGRPSSRWSGNAR